MIVCVCRRVSDRDIVKAVKEGAACFDSLQMDTGVATQCGRCADCAQEVFQQACGQHLGALRAVIGTVMPGAARAS